MVADSEKYRKPAGKSTSGTKEYTARQNSNPHAKRIKRRITGRRHDFFIATAPHLNEVCKNELLLQLRSEKKIRYPLHWELSASGMIDPGQTGEEAAAQELAEELGVKNIDLKEEVSFQERSDISIPVTVFSCVWNGAIVSNEEVAETKWVAIKELRAFVTDNPCTPNLQFMAQKLTQ